MGGVWSPRGGPDATGASGGDRGPVGPAWGDLTRQESPPQPALLAPVDLGGQGHQVGQEDGVAAAWGRRQKEQCFLDVRGQRQQAQDLTDTCPRDMAQRLSRLMPLSRTRLPYRRMKSR